MALTIPTACTHVQTLKIIVYSFILILFFTPNMNAERPFQPISNNPTYPSFSSLTIVCPPSITVGITGSACAVTVQLPQLQNVSNVCSGAITTQVSSQLGNGYGPFNNIPLGLYPINCQVFNTCGDTSFCTYNVMVKDTKKPIAVIKSALYGNISSDGKVRIRASMLNQNSSDNCSNFTDLKYSFSSNPLDTLRIFDCNQLGVHSLTVSVFDESGNKSNGLSQVSIQDGMNYCTSSSIIANSSTSTCATISNIEYELSSTGFQETINSEEGQITFSELQIGANYSVKPQKNDNWLNGLNAYDLKLLQNHLTGFSLLNHPLKLIAADINHSNSVTYADFQLLRSLILGEILTINQNTSWRFLPKNQVFQNPVNPFATSFAEKIDFTNISAGEHIANFSGIKIGDLNGSASALTQTTNLESRCINNQPFLLISEVQAFKSGDIVQVSLAVAPKSKEITAFQLTFEFNMNNLSFQSASPSPFSSISFGNIGTAHLKEGAITVVNDFASPSIGADNPIIHATFKAITDGSLSESIHLSDRITPSAAYDKDGNKFKIQLDFKETPIVEGGLKLLSNFPNPFIEMTLLRFSLPEADDVVVNIYDAHGKSIFEVKNYFLKGDQQILLQRSDIGEPGIYIYQVKSKFGIATRKLIMF
jgi:hypothetical protein